MKPGPRLAQVVISVLVAAVAVLIALVLIGTKFTSDWLTIWTAMLVALGIVTLAAFVAAAFFAWQQVAITRDNARIELTNEVLNSTWINTGVDALMHYCGNDFQGARTRLTAAYTASLQGTPLDADSEAVIRRTQGAYLYLARLYTRGVLDRELTIESCAQLATVAIFVLQDILRSHINNGFLEDSTLDFGRACYARFRQRPEVLIFNPFMRNWTF